MGDFTITRGSNVIQLILGIVRTMEPDSIMKKTVESKIVEIRLGFRKGRETDNGLFLIRHILEELRELRKDAAFCFVDLVKAFDPLSRKLACRAMGCVRMLEAK